MKLAPEYSRLFFLNLLLPFALSFHSGMGHVFPSIDITSVKKFVIYISCTIPAFYFAHLASVLMERALRHTRLDRRSFPLLGAAIAIPFCFAYTTAYWLLAWNWVPWLRAGFSYDFSPVLGDFSLYLKSGSTLLFIPLWFFANMLYEYASGDRFYFRKSAPDARPRGQAEESGKEADQGPISPAPAGFLSKIPLHLGRTVIAVRAQQHYVRVYTTVGEDLILYRFGDVVTELEASGLAVQVHRSYCVSPAAVVRMERGERNPLLVMSNGLKIPVSQSYRALLDKHLHRKRDFPAAARQEQPAI